MNKVAIKMIYKLNDATFRPVFVKLLEWATATSSKKGSKARLYRQTTWYSFLHSFFETLKVCNCEQRYRSCANISVQSIVTSYAGFVIDSAVEVLSDDAPKDETAKTLWRRVLHTLHSAFEHDQDGMHTACRVTSTRRANKSRRILANPFAFHRNIHPSPCPAEPRRNPPHGTRSYPHHHRTCRRRRLRRPP